MLAEGVVASVYDAPASTRLCYIVSEFVEGRTLRMLLGEGPLQHRTAIDIAILIAEALSVAHAAGIVHREIKPENHGHARGSHPWVFASAGTQRGMAEAIEPPLSP